MDIKRSYQIETTLTAKRVCQLINDGKINDLPLFVATDDVHSNTISEGTLFSNLGSYSNIAPTILDSTHILLIFNNSSASIYATILTISGNSISIGTVNTILSSGIYYTLSLALDSTHVLISYTTNSQLNATILTISGNSISIGTVVQTTSTSANDPISLTKIDSTHVLVTFKGCGSTYINYLYSVVLTISGNNISSGTTALINSLVGNYVSITAINNTHILVAYSDSTNAYLYAVVLTINIDIISVGTATLINSSFGIPNISLTTLDRTHVLVAFNSTSGLYAIVLTINSDIISLGATTLINGSSYNSLSTSIKLDSTHVLIIYDNNSTYLYGAVLAISGNSISAGTKTQINNTANDHCLSLTTLDSTHFLVSYLSNDYSTLHAVVLSIQIITLGNSKNGKSLGIAQDENGTVMLKGISKGHTGLLNGFKYYYDSNGVISTTNTGKYVGYAISSTELLITDYIIS